MFLSFIYPSFLSLLHSSSPPWIYSCFHPFFPSIHPSSFHPFYLPLSYPFIPPPFIYILFFPSSIFSSISLSIQSFYVPFFHPSTLPLFLYYIIHPPLPASIHTSILLSICLSIIHLPKIPFFHPSILFQFFHSYFNSTYIYSQNVHHSCISFFLFSILPSIYNFFINPFYLLLFNHISIQPFFVIFIHKYILPSITCSSVPILTSFRHPSFIHLLSVF